MGVFMYREIAIDAVATAGSRAKAAVTTSSNLQR
jgi:hypothetical protein